VRDAAGLFHRQGQDHEAELLASAYHSSLQLATQHQLQSIAFPAISTGVYSYPLDAAARIALTTVIDYLNAQNGLKLVRFVLFNDDILDTFRRALAQIARERSIEPGA
jgi:O-acetyl-ADP-ribose deacetylase